MVGWNDSRACVNKQDPKCWWVTNFQWLNGEGRHSVVLYVIILSLVQSGRKIQIYVNNYTIEQQLRSSLTWYHKRTDSILNIEESKKTIYFIVVPFLDNLCNASNNMTHAV